MGICLVILLLTSLSKILDSVLLLSRSHGRAASAACDQPRSHGRAASTACDQPRLHGRAASTACDQCRFHQLEQCCLIHQSGNFIQIIFRLLNSTVPYLPGLDKRFDPFAIPKKKLTFVLAQFFSVGFIPFLSWRATLIALPISMVSNQPMMNSLGHYYQDLPMIIVFISVILGLQTYENRQSAFFSFRPLELTYQSQTPISRHRATHWPQP